MAHTHSPHTHHAPADARHEGHAHGDEDTMAVLLDLDAEVLRDYLSELTAWIGDLAAGTPVRRILDLGAGTGTGTFALLDRFDGAEVVALDISAAMLERIRHKAHRLGRAERVMAVQADLDVAWPVLDPVDLVWASSSIHHMADPDRALAEVASLLRPGGLVAVTEMDSFARFLPEDLGFGRPGLEERSHAALDHDRAERMPHIGSDWGARLAAAGLLVEAERRVVVHLTPPHADVVGRYAQTSLRHMRAGLGDHLDAQDLATLDALADTDSPECVIHRSDLTVRTTRTTWVARRP
ncbi:MAG: methyltransferase domain-containing protein [Cellulomonadaceae bacterium]|nr:methyltransferase domain-containing protein [Cellulomonadaceae bacterium]